MSETQPASASLDEMDPPPPSLGERVKRVFTSPARMLGALLLPDRTMPTVVREGPYAAAMLVVTLAALLAAFAIGTRLDVSGEILARQADIAPTTATAANAETQEAPKSDRQIDEDIAKERSVARLKLGLGAGVGVPFKMFLLAVAVYLLGRYVGGKPTMRGTVAAVAHASLPGAVKSLLVAGLAWRLPSIVPSQVGSLAPPLVSPADPVAARLAAGADAFTLWTVVILGFGLAAAASISRVRAFVTISIAFLLWLAVTRLVVS